MHSLRANLVTIHRVMQSCFMTSLIRREVLCDVIHFRGSAVSASLCEQGIFISRLPIVFSSSSERQ